MIRRVTRELWKMGTEGLLPGRNQTVEQIFVGRTLHHVSLKGLHGIEWRAAVERPEETMVLFDHVPIDKQLFISRSAFSQVDGRIDSFVRQFAIKHDLGITRSFELLENDLIHATTRIDESRGNERQGTTAFDIAGRTEDLAGNIHRLGIQSPGKRATTSLLVQVEVATESGQRVEQHHYVLAHLHQPLGIFKG